MRNHSMKSNMKTTNISTRTRRMIGMKTTETTRCTSSTKYVRTFIWSLLVVTSTSAATAQDQRWQNIVKPWPRKICRVISLIPLSWVTIMRQALSIQRTTNTSQDGSRTTCTHKNMAITYQKYLPSKFLDLWHLFAHVEFWLYGQ